MLEAAREAFAAQINHIRAPLLSGTILQSDETGLRVGKRNWWLWVFHHDDSAIFVIEPSRGKCVVEGFLGAFRPDFWVSDRYGGQMGWAKKAIRSASLISFATCNMPSTPATAFPHPVCTICFVEPAGLADGETSSRT
jgi:Transposase IS66 family